MDRNTCKNLREQLASILKDHGIEGYQITVGNASYDSISSTFKVEVKEKGAKSTTQLYAETEAAKHGLAMVNGAGDMIVDYNFKAPKYPWIVKKADGKQYKFTFDGVKRAFAS